MKQVADFKDPAFTHSVVTISLKDKNGQGETWTVESIVPNQGYDIPMTTTLCDVTTCHTTTMAITKIVIAQPLPARVFTQSFLESGK